MDAPHQKELFISSSVFFALQLTGGLGLSLLAIIVAAFPNVNRHPTWFSFCISWSMSAISYSLLLLAGQKNRAPIFQLCATQAALVYSAPVLTGMTTFAMFFHVYLTIHTALTKADLSRIRGLRKLLIITPYASWTISFVALLVFSAIKPDYVQMADNGYYCNFSTPVPKRISASVSFIFLTAIVAFEGIITVCLYRQWRRLSTIGPKAVNMTIRVLIFGIGAILAWILCIIYLIPVIVASPSIDIILAILPFLGLIIFATQSDLYHGRGSNRASSMSSSKLTEIPSATL
ncbi:hypothetical protein E1B28_002761 [Marasmius oreades]|nr:uncharacterized protein E1B28_002761 [Marasmius oreades]KAG7086839.1 hypothetical protein E1B28_002761 [Marasmius oreades]